MLKRQQTHARRPTTSKLRNRSMPKIRGLMVEGESPARCQGKRFLASAVDFEGTGEAGTGLAALRLLAEQKLDVLRIASSSKTAQ